MPKENEVMRSWHHIDATDKVLGRLAGEIARLLRGKHKPQFSYHVDVGDFVVVTNAAKMAIAPERAEKETYIRHSGYPGGLKSSTLAREFERRPEEVLRRAVKGMMPKNRLGRRMLKKLKIYAGSEHPHEAQLKGTPSPPNQGKRKKTKPKPKPQTQKVEREHDAASAEQASESDDFASMKATELKALAKERGIKGAGSMKKAELVEALAATPDAGEPEESPEAAEEAPEAAEGDDDSGEGEDESGEAADADEEESEEDA